MQVPEGISSRTVSGQWPLGTVGVLGFKTNTEVQQGQTQLEECGQAQAQGQHQGSLTIRSALPHKSVS